jgi:predicted nucleic acid-binding protein
VTRALAVFDTSVLLRAALDESEGARAWTTRMERREIVVLAPDLIWAELTNVFAFQVRARAIEGRAAAEILEHLLALPLETEPMRAMAGGALATALRHRLSGYDAFYLVLADAAEAVLVTADRKLARAAERAELVV